MYRVFPESRSTYESFLKNDEDYLNDKNKIINYDVKNTTFTGLYYLWYFINFGDDDSKLTRTTGEMIENPDIEVFNIYIILYSIAIINMSY